MTTYALFAALNILDILTTHAGLTVGISEGNPVPAMILTGHGELAMYGVKTALMGLFAWVVAWRRHLWAVMVVNVLLTAAVVSNMGQVWG